MRNFSTLTHSVIFMFKKSKCFYPYIILFHYTVSGPLQIRLVGGKNSNEGRVEVLHNNVWGTVCGDSWSAEEATVVCRQLGLPHLNAEALGSIAFGEGSGQIWLQDVVCSGSESNLNDCNLPDWGTNNCHHREDVGVVCSDGMIYQYFVFRLILYNHDNVLSIVCLSFHKCIVKDSMSNFENDYISAKHEHPASQLAKKQNIRWACKLVLGKSSIKHWLNKLIVLLHTINQCYSRDSTTGEFTFS